MAESVGKHQQTKRKREREKDRTRSIARQFAWKQTQIRQKFGIKNSENTAKASKPIMKHCITRTLRRKFGISFTIPDRIAAEISDRKKISGSRPLRIIRIPSGGPTEFHAIVEEAEKGSPPVKNQQPEKPPDPKTAYHRSRLNDWHPHLVHCFSDH